MKKVFNGTSAVTMRTTFTAQAHENLSQQKTDRSTQYF